MDGQAQKPKRSRKSAPKSRQGCITCKTRHVKCDEVRPFCKRCAKAGRQCEGYPDEGDSSVQNDSKATSSSSSSTALTRVASTVNSRNKKSSNQAQAASEAFSSLGDPSGIQIRLNISNVQEARYLEYFYTRTAPAISGFFDTNFYNKLLLQAGQHETAIRHAMMAVGAMHEHFEFSVVPALEHRREPVASTEKPAFALQQYNKAISALSKQLSSGPGSMESVLMCCLLFVCLECLRGDNRAAGTHLKSGGDIIANMASRKQISATAASSSSSASSSRAPNGPVDSKFVEEHITPIFERLSTHASGAAKLTSMEFSDLINPNIYHEDESDVSFDSLDEARKSIMHLGSLVTRFTKSMAAVKFGETITEEQVRVLAGIYRRLQLWEESMTAFLAKYSANGISRRAAVLRVQHCCFKVVAVGALSPEQCANDHITKDFEIGIDIADMLQGNSYAAQDDEQDLSAFSLEEGVTPALYLFATRCRIPSLRRKAVATILKGPRRQGIWNAMLLAKVAERVIDLEENFQPPIQPQPPVDMNTGFVPSLVDPIFDANIDPSLINMPMTPESIESYHTDPSLDVDPSSIVPGVDTQFSLDDAPIMPPENARIHHTDIKESTDGTPHHHSVTFFRKPFGLNEEWDIWTEEVFI